MTRRSAPLAVAGVMVLVGVCWATGGATPRQRHIAGIQAALERLRAGQHYRAELIATELTEDEAFTGRAWLIVAESEFRRGEPSKALAAYQQFLKTCDSVSARQYVVARMATCRQADQTPTPTAVPSDSLTDRQKASLAAVDTRTHTATSRHFVVQAHNAAVAKLVADEGEQALSRICGDILPQEYPHTVEVFVWADHKDYLANAPNAPEWSGGSFSIDVRNGVIYRRIDLTQLDEQRKFSTVMLDRVLPHEMCHLVLKEYFGDAACPLFLNEGLAMLAESGLHTQRLILAGAALAGDEKIPLEKLLVAARPDHNHEGVFYAEALSFTEFLHSRLTRQQFKTFLAAVKDDCAVADALQRALYVAPRPDFLATVAAAWEARAVRQGQFLKALQAPATLVRMP